MEKTYLILVLLPLFALAGLNDVVDNESFDHANGVAFVTATHNADCAEAIGAKLNSATENGYSAWVVHGKCNNHLLQATVVFFLAALDGNEEVVDSKDRAALGLALEELYLQPTEVPYHNAVHGADLTEKIMYFMNYEKGGVLFGKYIGLTKLEYIAACFAGAGHDAGHDGSNNALAREVKSFVGTTYNGILELFSADLTISLLLGKENSNSAVYEKFLFQRLFDHEEPAVQEVRRRASFKSVKSKKSRKSKAKRRTAAHPEVETAYNDRQLKVIANLKKHEAGFLKLSDAAQIQTLLGIIRQGIYSTIMSPLDNRFSQIQVPKGHFDDSTSSFDYDKFTTLFGKAFLKNINYYEASFVPPGFGSKFTETTIADFGDKAKDDDFKDFKFSYPKGGAPAEIKGMANLEGQATEDQAKWFLIGQIVHLSDIGNAFYGFTFYKPWWEKLMMEWATIDCYKGFFPPYGPNVKGFQFFVVYFRAVHMNAIIPGWGFSGIVKDDMGHLMDHVPATTKEKVNEKNELIKPFETDVKGPYDAAKGSGAKCPVTTASLSKFNARGSAGGAGSEATGSHQSNGHSKRVSQRKKRAARRNKKAKRVHKRA